MRQAEPSKQNLPPGVLRQAARVLTGQARSKRPLFDSWPRFVQRTLWHADGNDGFDVSWRQLPVEERLTQASRLKDEGNGFFHAGDYNAAAIKYEQAAGLFHYVKRLQQSPDASLYDACVQLVTDGMDPASYEEELIAKVRLLRISCYTNIAQCLLSQTPQPDAKGAKRACDSALALDVHHVKSLYRRALAHERLGSLKAAEEDLRCAANLASDKGIREAQSRVRSARRQRLSAERGMFQGVLRRHDALGSQHGGSDFHDRHDLVESEHHTSSKLTGADLGRTIEDAAKLRDFYHEHQCSREARELEGVIEQCTARLEDREQRSVNVLQPTQELIDEAMKFGIDLHDPQQRHELDRVMWEMRPALEQLSENKQNLAVDFRQVHRKACSRCGLLVSLIRKSRLLRACLPSAILALAFARLFHPAVWRAVSSEHTAII